MKKSKNEKRELSTAKQESLLETLEARFNKNMGRHPKVDWSTVLAALKKQKDLLCSLNEMEETGGEPDVVAFSSSKKIVFVDCSAESPSGRRSYCYDREALDSRKEAKPKDCATDCAAAMGIELLSEDDYRELQELGKFDLKTSSWVLTPADVRKLGGALFCDRRYGRVFVYHNSAQSYYAVRGFRGKLTVS